MDRPEASDRELHLRELLAEAMQRLDEGGQQSLDAFLAAHSAEAPVLRRRLQLLLGSGMLGTTRPDASIPEHLGEFRLQRRLGSGGMGVVYLAEQPSLERSVALKLIRPEQLYFPQARERFAREIAAVARLQHPGIVRVYASGEEAGLPYFTMEMVEGVSLDRLLQELRPIGPLKLDERHLQAALIALGGEGEVVRRALGGTRGWVEICCGWLKDLAEALAYAHGRGVLHRDLKPANVMVTWTGRVVMLDFGLASTREANRITRTGSQLGSLPYMAPEQVRGERDAIDARTDVYALGVTLYEALTLQSPFHDAGSSDEDVRRRIAQATPVSLRNHNPAVSRDAETVCLCAMAPEPSHRYQTAADFAQDLGNVLGLRPLLAQRASTAVRLRRLVRRRPALATAVGMGFLLLVVTPTAVAVREYRLRTEVTSANDTREETLRFLNNDLLAAVTPDEAGKDASMRAVLDAASKKIEGRFPDRPRVEAAIRETLGQTYRKLGVLDVAEQHLLRAIELWRQELGADDRKTIDAERKLAVIKGARGLYEEAEQMNRRAYTTLRTAYGMEDSDTLSAANNLGLQLVRLTRYDEAVVLLQEVVDVRLRVLGERHDHTLTSMSNLGHAYSMSGRYAAAEPWIRRELELCRKVKGDEHAETLISRNNQADLLDKLGRTEEAALIFEETVAISRRVYGDRHFETINFINNLGKMLAKLGRQPAADACFQEVIAASPELGANHHLVRSARLQGIRGLHRRGQAQEALLAIDEFVQATPTEAGRRERLEASILRASICLDLGRAEEGARELSVAIGAGAEKSARVAAARVLLGKCLRVAGRHAEAEAELVTVHALCEANAFVEAREALQQLVALYEAWQRPDDAAAWRSRLEAWLAAHPQATGG